MITRAHKHCPGKRLKKGPGRKDNPGARLAALLLCLSLLAGFLPALAWAASAEERFSSIVGFDSITLHYAGPGGQPEGAAIKSGALIEKSRQLVLRYTYAITEEQCKAITAGTRYYLEVSPHLSLPDLGGGAELTIETGNGPRRFGAINADGVRAWVTFDGKADGSGTVLSEYGELQNAYFYLNCRRADTVPPGELPIAGTGNLYAMKFEDNGQLNFGYAENEPVTAKARIEKDGSLQNRTITWTIDYTPWQNPGGDDPVDLGTPFELRDRIDAALHSFVPGSVTVDGVPAASFHARGDIPADAAAYVLVESSGDGGDTLLSFGGAKFNAVQSTKGNPAAPLAITYQTVVNEDLLLPGGSGGGRVTNAADLYAGDGGAFNRLTISGGGAVDIPQPVWMTKTGSTTRHTDGTGSTTAWTVVFQPNGFSFTGENGLTLHDQLPYGSTLVTGSVKVDGTGAAASVEADNSFTVSPVITDKQPVTITYQTHVPEEMYDSGTSLGNNAAWFTFDYKGASRSTPVTETPVGSGDGSGTPGTATLVKSNSGYDAAHRTIEWTVKINPHQAYLKGGTFTDRLDSVGPQCTAGHGSGLELVGDVKDIDVTVNGKAPAPEEAALLDLEYDRQVLTVKVGEIGAKTIALTFTTRVCDPCVFANNRQNVPFTNTISTDDMLIGSQASVGRSASADSTAKVGAAVLAKKPPVYDYASGIMRWTVEVDAAGLPMADVVLTDDLPAGLAYVEGSLKTVPGLPDASAKADGQTLTVDLGTVAETTAVTFDTRVDPEALGFGGDKPVVVENTVCMNGSADGVTFAEVFDSVEQSFSNHGLVKHSDVDNRDELIRYEVLINPFGLALPERPALVDTLDKRLQLDTDSLRFYEAEVNGTTETGKDQRPDYTKKGDGQPLNITGFDPDTNSFTVELPIAAGGRGAYVLTYTADMLRREADGYGNSVRFEGGSVLLGGGKDNTAAVGGGGGGGGGGVAARKATISVVKTDRETRLPISGVSFLLYQWDLDGNMRGLPFAQGTTDAQGKLSFRVKPGAAYELVETESAPGYGGAFGWTAIPDGAAETDGGLLVTAGAAASELKLELTNEAHTTGIVFRLVNASGIPLAGAKVRLFKTDPGGTADPVPDLEVAVAADGTVEFPDIRRGGSYYIQTPDGGIMTVEVPVQADAAPNITLPDGTSAALTKDFLVTGTTERDQEWTLTVHKVVRGSDAPLAGASIGLYADAACETLIKTDMSARDGTIAFEGLIKGQTYWLKEITAPVNYSLNSTVYEADSANSTVTISNAPKAPPVNPADPIDSAPPSTSEGPVASEAPVASEGPGESETPGEPEGPGESGGAGNSGGSGSGHSSGDPDIPWTGDSTPHLAAVALLSGLLLAAVTVYQVLRSKKREEA